MQNIKIIGRVGPTEDRALLCEIPRSLAANIKIDSQGEVDAFDLIKILRRAYIKQATQEKNQNQDPKKEQKNIQKSIYSNGLSEPDRENLYKLIFDKTLAIDLKNSPKNKIKTLWNSEKTEQKFEQRKAS